MAQEKETGFRVTDKRAAFTEETPPQPAAKTTAPAGEPKQDPKPHASDQDGAMPLPEANFLTLLLSLYTHAQICLGIISDPVSQQPQKDLPQAKYNIDMLEVIQEKTKGNLSKEEEQALEHILYDVRMAYIEYSK
jgi:hypothetical protein